MKSQLKSLVVLTLESPAEVVFIARLARLAANRVMSGSSAARLEALLGYSPHFVQASEAAAAHRDLDNLRAQPIDTGRPQTVAIESLTAELLGFIAKELSKRFEKGEGMDVLIDLGPLHVGSDPQVLNAALLEALTMTEGEIRERSQEEQQASSERSGPQT